MDLCPKTCPHRIQRIRRCGEWIACAGSCPDRVVPSASHLAGVDAAGAISRK